MILTLEQIYAKEASCQLVEKRVPTRRLDPVVEETKKLEGGFDPIPLCGI